MIIKKRSEIFKEAPAKEQKKESKVESVDLFDLDNIDFSQRQERRRGDRRRGYRRIDDRNLISRAQEEAGTIKDSAATEGYKEGLARAAQDIENLKNSITSFMSAPREVFEYIAPDILEISVDIARKIVKKEIEQNPEIIFSNILDVLRNVSKNESKITVYVNSQQVSMVKESIGQILSITGLDAKINILADDTIELGGCILKTNNGIIDATIETQIEIIKESLKGI